VQPLTSPSEADIDDILAIEQSSFPNPWSREMYLSELANTGLSHFFVVRDAHGQVIGFCTFWVVADEEHIHNIAVAPRHRRQGVASSLLRRALDEGNRRGIRQTTLEVRRSNRAAKELYERFGFVVVGVRTGYYSQPAEDALIFRR
jgi:ribosomal-protein-alanine N-acetyltransferase